MAGGHILLATMGSGKSQAAPREIYEYLVARTAELGRPCVALMASPTREQALRWKQQAIAQGVPRVVDVLGRDASNCSQPAVCAAVASAGYEPMAVVCSRCRCHPSKAMPRSRVCPYMLRLEELLKATEPAEAFCCYEAVPHLAGNGIRRAKQRGYPLVWVGGWRTAPCMLSPEMWRRFAWPYFSRLVCEVVDAGLIALLHLDSDWTRELECFKELPRGRCIMALDGETDIFKAKIREKIFPVQCRFYSFFHFNN